MIVNPSVEKNTGGFLQYDEKNVDFLLKKENFFQN